MKPKILVTRKLVDLSEQRLLKNFDAKLNLEDEPIPHNDLAKIANEYDGIICSSWDKLDKTFFEKLNQKVKIIAQIGIGYDNIDIVSAKKKNIIVTNSPNKANESVAEIVFYLMIGVSRRTNEGIELIKKDKWKNAKIDWHKFMVGDSLKNKTLGIVGMGRIGRDIAKKAKAFDMNVVYHNRKRLEQNLENNAEYFSTVNEMVKKCDFISVNCPGSKDSHKVLNREAISLMKKNAIVINTSRGDNVDDDALIEALQNKKIYGAGLDVFNNEPNLDKRYLELENCILLPHIGSASNSTREEMGSQAVENLEAFFSNKSLISQVN
ncbi:D-glycerate dehydrogenase [Candidatus Pelagibacter sp.]|nr:D-glycerate dehydrogenase [Candidatus Pelagibacter sp.]